jgi:hypothetical protein
MRDAAHGGFSAGINHKPKSRSEPRSAQCPQTILMQAVISATDSAQDASRKISATTNMINDLTRLWIFKEPIDGEVAAQCILAIVAETHCIRPSAIDVDAVGAECCNLYRATAVADKHHSEGLANAHSARENLSNFIGNGAGCNVVIRSIMTEDCIAHAASGEERSVPCLAQLARHPCRCDARLKRRAMR